MDTVIASMFLLGLSLYFLSLLFKAVKLSKRDKGREQLLEVEYARKRIEINEEEKRKILLREKDKNVDPIIRALISAKMDLERIIAKAKAPNSSKPTMSDLEEWQREHQAVMGFHVFQRVKEIYIENIEDTPAAINEEVDELLEEHFDAENCLHYADEVLGIQRRYTDVDGLDYGWVEYERSDGRYEDVNIRFERIQRGMPGTDRGYVYILTNASLPGLLKIGKTHREPEARAAELSDLTGVPTPFKLAYKHIVSNCGLVEATVHQRLSGYRVADNREFFAIDVQKAIQIIEQVSEECDRGLL